MRILWFVFIVPLALMTYVSIRWIVRMARTALSGMKGKANDMALEVFLGLACAVINFTLGLAYFMGLWPTSFGRLFVSDLGLFAPLLLLLFIMTGFGFGVGIVRLVRFSLFGPTPKENGTPRNT